MIKTKQDQLVALEIGHKLHKLRKARNLTQEQLAEAMACCRERISRIENGKVCPTHSFILALAKYFQVDPNYFTTTEREDKNNENRQTN